MAAPTDIGRRWCLAETPDPGEVTLITFVDRFNVDLRDIPTAGSTFKTWTQASGFTELVAAHGDWTFAQMKTPAAPGQMNSFYWVRPRTDEEKAIPFRSFYTTQTYSWPAVLEDLHFVFDEAFPLMTQRAISSGNKATVFVPQVYARRAIRPPLNENSRMLVEEFLSNTPFSEDDMTHESPQESVVEWDFNGASGSITCLHGEVIVPSRGKNGQEVYSSTTSTVAAAYEPERIFPPTNFRTWSSFVFSDEQKFVDGQWYRRRCTLIPPPLRTIIVE